MMGKGGGGGGLEDVLWLGALTAILFPNGHTLIMALVQGFCDLESCCGTPYHCAGLIGE